MRCAKSVLAGSLGREIAEGARQGGMAPTRIAETVDASGAAELLKTVVQQGDVMLVKASRGMKMEQVVQTVMGMRAIAKQAS